MLTRPPGNCPASPCIKTSLATNILSNLAFYQPLVVQANFSLQSYKTKSSKRVYDTLKRVHPQFLVGFVLVMSSNNVFMFLVWCCNVCVKTMFGSSLLPFVLQGFMNFPIFSEQTSSLLVFPEQTSSLLVFSVVCFAQSLVFCVLQTVVCLLVDHC